MPTATTLVQRLCCFALLAALALPAPAQDRPVYGDLPIDSTFGTPSNPGTAYLLFMRDYWGSLRGPDGSYYVAGHARLGNDGQQTRHNRAALGHFLANGRVDSTFGGGLNGYTVLDPLGVDARFTGMVMQRGGKVVAVGDVDDRLLLARFLPDGQLDTSFGTNGYYLAEARAPALELYGLTVLPDDRILVLPSNRAMWWFAADGRLDSTQHDPWNRAVAPGTPEAYFLYGSPVVLPGGKMLVLVSDNDVVKELSLARLNADGTRDTAFGAANGYTKLEHTSLQPYGPGRQPGVVVDGDGRIYVYGTQNGALMVARFTPDGHFDPAFDGDGIATFDAAGGEDAAHALLLLPDGRVLAGGRMNWANRANGLLLVMFNPDGTRDATFGLDGVVAPRNTLDGSWYGGLYLDADGKLVATFRAGPAQFNERGDRPFIARYLTSLPASTAAEDAAVPAAVALHGAYPNPFNPATTLAYALPAAAHVRLSVYDLLGREVARLVDAVQPAGAHTAVFAAEGLPSGVYLYRLDAGGQARTRSMVLLK